MAISGGGQGFIFTLGLGVGVYDVSDLPHNMHPILSRSPVFPVTVSEKGGSLEQVSS